jgi:hypothetical protein
MAKTRAKAKAKASVRVNVNVNSKNKITRRLSSNIRQPMMYSLPPVVIQHHSTPQVPIVINQPFDSGRTNPVGINIHNNSSLVGSGGESTQGKVEPKPESTGESASKVGSAMKNTGEALGFFGVPGAGLLKKAGEGIEKVGGVAQAGEKAAALAVEKFPRTTGLVAGAASGVAGLLKRETPALAPSPELTERSTIPQIKAYILHKGGDMKGKSRTSRNDLYSYAQTL